MRAVSAAWSSNSGAGSCGASAALAAGSLGCCCAAHNRSAARAVGLGMGTSRRDGGCADGAAAHDTRAGARALAVPRVRRRFTRPERLAGLRVEWSDAPEARAQHAGQLAAAEEGLDLLQAAL